MLNNADHKEEKDIAVYVSSFIFYINSEILDFDLVRNDMRTQYSIFNILDRIGYIYVSCIVFK